MGLLAPVQPGADSAGAEQGRRGEGTLEKGMAGGCSGSEGVGTEPTVQGEQGGQRGEDGQEWRRGKEGPRETTPLLAHHSDAAVPLSVPAEDGTGAVWAAQPSNSMDIHELLPSSAHLGSAKKTLFNIVISIVGSGVLGLPYTFMRSGWLLGSVAVCASALLAFHCMMLLVACRRKLEGAGHRGVRSYGDVGLAACGAWGEQAVEVLVTISQGGCCVAYLVFIAQNLSSVLPTHSHSTHLLFIILSCPFQVLLAWVRSLTSLVPFSIVADIANLLAMGLVIRDDLHSFTDFSNVSAFTTAANIPFALGVACYCYEGFAMTLPLQASMKNPSRFPTVLGLAMAAITVLYISFGIVGYVAFKGATKEIITLNLPNDWSTVGVKLALCLGLFLTFPVMMHPVHEIVERRLCFSPAVRDWLLEHSAVRTAVFRSARAGVVLLVTVVAIQVPGFARFISLVGSTVCAMLAFVLPALFHLCISCRLHHHSLLGISSDCVIIAFGFLFAVYGTYETIG